MSKFYKDGEGYYIDIESITERCRTGDTIKEEDGSEATEVNIFKYEVLKMCIDRVLGDFEGEEDDGLGGLFKSKSLSFQIAFNTLLKNEILIEDNE